MAKRSVQATYLAQQLSQWVQAPVEVAWESQGVGRGDWSVRWSDGPTSARMRKHLAGLARWVHPLDVTRLRLHRDHSPRAWAAALIAVAATEDAADAVWQDLLGQAEAWLYAADHPGGDGGVAVDELVRRGDGRETVMARRLSTDRDAQRPTVVDMTEANKADDGVTEIGDETRCAQCGAAVARPAVGRPARYCSPACRTRAWRTRHVRQAETKPSDETVCAQCGTPIARTGATGRPPRYCSPACRTRAWRQRADT